MKVWMLFQKSFHFIAYLCINISSDNLTLLILNVSTWNLKISIAVVDRLFSQTNQIDAWHISKRNKSFSWQLHWAAAVPKYFHTSPAVSYLLQRSLISVKAVMNVYIFWCFFFDCEFTMRSFEHKNDGSTVLKFANLLDLPIFGKVLC